MPTGDTPAEQAAFIRDEANWIDVYTIATLLNVTSWSSVEDDVLFNAAVEPYEFTFQNTTFEIKEIVFNRITTTSTTLLNNNWVTVQPDGTMMYEVSTETTCCICGRSFSVESIGQDFLLPISGSLSTCDTICNIEDEWCNDIAVELRGGDVIEEIDDENSTDTESTAAAATADTAIITTTTTTEPTTAIKATANATVISSESDNVVSNYTPPTIDIIIEPPNKGEDIPVDNKEAAQEASSGSMVFASILWVLVVCLVFGV